MTNFRWLTIKAIARMEPPTGYRLAKVLGVKATSVYRWRSGERKPDGENAIKLQNLAEHGTLTPGEADDPALYGRSQVQRTRWAVADLTHRPRERGRTMHVPTQELRKRKRLAQR